MKKDPALLTIAKQWRHYQQLAAQQMLAEALIDKEDSIEQMPGGGSSGEYSERYADHELMKGVVGSLNEGEVNTEVVQAIDNDMWEEGDPHRFAESLYASQRSAYLTPYSLGELASMNLFKLSGHKMGFAIKADGDIVAVHNNAGVSGVGTTLMVAATRNGGSKLDHFDGFLTGFYDGNGFGKIVAIDAWNDEYAPEGWEYELVNIWDPRTSVYAEQLKKYNKIDEVPSELRAKIQAYESGKPDIIYRIRG